MARLQIQRISDFSDPTLQPYATMRRPVGHEEQGIFVAEGTKVVRRLIESSFPIVSVVLPYKFREEYEPLLAARSETEIPVYLADNQLLSTLVGFPMFQGVMAVGRIPEPETLDSILSKSARPRLFAALDEVSNAENLGTLVRNCAAFGVQALIIGETSGSPFIRRSVRASMGTIFQLPVTHVSHLAQSLRELSRLGTRAVAAHPHADGSTLAKADLTGDTCVVFGAEGTGIRPEVLAACDEAVSIPMAGTVDSLNVSAAAAVFLYEVCRQRGRM